MKKPASPINTPQLSGAYFINCVIMFLNEINNRKMYIKRKQNDQKSFTTIYNDISILLIVNIRLSCWNRNFKEFTCYWQINYWKFVEFQIMSEVIITAVGNTMLTGSLILHFVKPAPRYYKDIIKLIKLFKNLALI